MFRHLLFVPGHRPELVEKALRSGADALILDLEDAVPHASKAQARESVRQVLGADKGKPMYVRLSHPEEGWLDEDLAALVCGRLMGVLLPKCERVAELQRVAEGLSRVEERCAVADGSLQLIPMLETCLGLRDVFDIARASPRVCGVALGTAEEGDLMHDMGGRWTADGAAMAYPRARLVCEARAAGIEWLIDGVFMNLQDDAALRGDATLARNVGFNAKLAIHPRQLPVIEALLRPGDAELAYARGLLAAFEQAEASGHAAIQYQGKMVDYANVKVARRLLAMAGAA